MILEDLWSGRFYPAETVVPTDPTHLNFRFCFIRNLKFKDGTII